MKKIKRICFIVIIIILSYSLWCQSIWEYLKNGNLEKVKIFVEKNGFDLDTQDNNGLYPIEYAIRYNHIDILEYIISKKDKIQADQGDNIEDLLLFKILVESLNRQRFTDPKTIQILIDAGVRIEFPLNSNVKVKNILELYLVIGSNHKDSFFSSSGFYVFESVFNYVGIIKDHIFLKTKKRYELSELVLNEIGYNKDSYQLKDLILDVYMQNFEKIKNYIKKGNDPKPLIKFALFFDDLDTYKFFKDSELINDIDAIHLLDTSNITAVFISSYLGIKGNIDTQYLGKWQFGEIIIKLDKEKIYFIVTGNTTINTTYFIINNTIYYFNNEFQECALKILPSGDLFIEDTKIIFKKIEN